MIVNKLLEQLNQDELYQNTFKIGFLPNDGKLVEGLEEGIISFNEKSFSIFVFEGIFKPKYKEKLEFLFAEIKEIEMGKYNFKDRYLKLIFDDEKYLVFNYLLKQRKYKEQALYANKFIDILHNISNESN